MIRLNLYRLFNLRMVVCVCVIFISLVLIKSINAKERTINYPISNELSTLDPIEVTNAEQVAVINQIYENVVEYDQNMRPEPVLLKKWEVSLDGTQYFFTLKDNIKFHNNKILNAYDIKYSWERMLKLKGQQFLWIFNNVVGVDDFLNKKTVDVSGFEIVNDKLLRVSLRKPMALFVKMLATPNAKILAFDSSKRVIAENGIMVGTGPYVFKERTKKKFTVSFFPTYHGNSPRYKTINFIKINNQNNALTLFKDGEVDFIVYRFVDEDIKKLLNKYKHKFIQKLESNMLIFNLSNDIYANRYLRTAIYYAINKKKLQKLNSYEPIGYNAGMWGNGLSNFHEMFQGADTYDLEKALDNMNEYRKVYRKDIHVQLEYGLHSNNVSEGEVQSICDDLKKIDIHCLVKYYEYSKLSKRRKNKAFSISRLGYTVDYPDPDALLYPLIHSNQQFNHMTYSNKEVDRLLELARRINDIDSRQQVYSEIISILQYDVPFVPLYSPMIIIIYNDKFETMPVNERGLSYVRFKEF